MPNAKRLSQYPVHLDSSGAACAEPLFTGDLQWYAQYGQRHAGDGTAGRLVAMHTFDSDWGMWEMHPTGHEVVICTEGRLTLIQERDGKEHHIELEPGQYAINEPGVWHTANTKGRSCALFITAGAGTEHRPREN